MSRSELTGAEVGFLVNPPERALARIATVDAEGVPHVVPGGWAYDAAAGELVLGGHDVLRTRRARHVRRSEVAAVVIDGLAPGPGWHPWGVLVRGRARVDEDAGALRVALDDISSWGLEGMARTRPARLTT